MTERCPPWPACFDCRFGAGFPCRHRDGSLRLDRLVDALLALAREEVGSPRHDVNFWAFDCMDTLVADEPELGFRVILFALPLFRTDREIGWLAAGPLETLVDAHGARMIDEIEREAAASARFRYLLSGIWGGPPYNDEAIWRRIQAAVRPGPWLDEDPRTPQGSDRARPQR